MPKRASFISRARQRMAQWLAPRGPAGGSARMYGAARNTRTTGGFGSSGNASADTELHTSLPVLRARSRQMIRDSAFAKRARTVIVNNVIGSGVGFQAQVRTTRNGEAARVNADIEAAFCEWARAINCHTGGRMHLHDLERAAFAEVFDAGEVFIRKHYARFGESRIPLALELVEAERLASDMVDTAGLQLQGEIRMGVEVDGFGRPLAYWMRSRHPGELRTTPSATDRWERVPAEDVYHLCIVDRWPQTRGEPWMHNVLRKLDDLNEYTGLEVTAARASAAYFGTIESPEDGAIQTDEDESGQPLMDVQPLTIQQLAPGEKLTWHAPNRPNTAMDPFVRAMLREVAAGVGTSYESLSRDYSQSNYSSSRLALLDDRDLYKVLQQWWIRSFREPLHHVWLQQAVLGGAVASVQPAQFAADVERYRAVVWKPRGWSWVDPTKEVNAYKEAIKGGLTTLTDVIAATQDGRDIEDIVRTRQRELQLLDEAGIDVDTTVEEPVEAPGVMPAMPAMPAEDDADTPDVGEDGAPAAPRGRHLQVARTA